MRKSVRTAIWQLLYRVGTNYILDVKASVVHARCHPTDSSKCAFLPWLTPQGSKNMLSKSLSPPSREVINERLLDYDIMMTFAGMVGCILKSGNKPIQQINST